MFGTLILTILGLYAFIKLITQFTNARCKSRVCLVEKVALITGGNSGLGLELAKNLASRGCTIIIADKVDSTDTVKNLIKESRNANISSAVVDFASFKSVRKFADDINKSVKELHILVNNAGISDSTMEVTEDGLQKIMQVNYFSHFLLTHLLLELLLKSSPARIIYTSSLAAYKADLSESNIKSHPPEDVTAWTTGAYGNSKVAGAIMSKMLAKKLQNTEVTSNAFHPGLVKTNIWTGIKRHDSIGFYLVWLWAYLFGKNTDEGVQTLIHLACSLEVEKLSGKFFMECRPVNQPKLVHEKELAQKVWSLSEKCVQLGQNETVDKILERWTSNK